MSKDCPKNPAKVQQVEDESPEILFIVTVREKWKKVPMKVQVLGGINVQGNVLAQVVCRTRFQEPEVDEEDCEDEMYVRAVEATEVTDKYVAHITPPRDHSSPPSAIRKHMLPQRPPNPPVLRQHMLSHRRGEKLTEGAGLGPTDPAEALLSNLTCLRELCAKACEHDLVTKQVLKCIQNASMNSTKIVTVRARHIWRALGVLI
jgi:hypothetical protein